ncbi:zinc finger protein BRUTUS isoform X2 [Selaginella moellendorffii]|uniref:zinc finger protein BRUTUS isoform X2 n=1 Tax=Selaginella moellendorffii TaxID=88036 RepID=UPI000D1C6AC0|nr:zinc finger protein BRUTUS isoform X2 [Selaginella moellendorffii]|eukprot:XP_024528341.1 zinc finger protein BRUTUS isoform X2 [Selaginella moellendorffii]
MASPVIVDLASAVPIVEPAAESEDDVMPPIMQFMYFHKAIRAELEKLHGDALQIAKSSDQEIKGLIRRYQFLRSVYEHHSSAEDEVILPALDLRVKNVAHSYSLEHQVEGNLFEQLFELLNAVLAVKDDGLKESIRNVVCCTEALLTTLVQHLCKEEEQVFPLLVKHFTYDEQAALVWQFLCSIPVNLMELFLPWLASSLSLEDRDQMIACMRRIVPSEHLLQQVIFAWLKGRETSGTKMSSMEQEALQPDDLSGDHQRKFPINKLLLWNDAIKKDMERLAEEAKLLRSASPSTLSSFVDRLRFLVEVCIFHSAAEDKVLSPAVGQRANVEEDNQHLEMVQRLADGILAIGHLEGKADELCIEVEYVIQTIREHYFNPELKLISLAQEHCTIEEQRVLLYRSLRVMPLRMLERVLPWFVEMQSDKETRDMLHHMCLAAPVSDKHLVALFSGWACKGCRQNSDSFKCIYAGEAHECPVKMLELEQVSNEESTSSAGSTRSKRPRDVGDSEGSSTSCKNAVLKQCCVPGLGMKCPNLGISRVPVRKPLSSPKSSSLGCSLFGWGKVDSTSPVEPKPIDHIFQFHKAIRKDMEYLDLESAKLDSCDETFLRQFTGRFHFLWGLYKAHSNAEDDIVFPALEEKEALHNVSHSYSLDHKQEQHLFEEIARFLEELSRLYIPDCLLEKSDINAIREKRGDLAQKLQGMCKSVRCSLDHHVAREELELWPLFDRHFTFEEQDRIVGRIVGTTGAEVLQSMIPWVTAALTDGEQTGMMESWRQATKNTMFDKWLSAWWGDSSLKSSPSSPPATRDPSTPPSGSSESLQLVADYFAKDSTKESTVQDDEGESGETLEPEETGDSDTKSESCKSCSKYDAAQHCCMRSDEKDKPQKLEADTGKFKPGWQYIFRMNQKELEAAIRKVSSDSSLDPRRKAYLIQNLMTSRWIAAQQHSLQETDTSGDIPGRSRSYHDPVKGIYGCEHYKRNCKIRAACCGSLFVCRFCHDRASDHPMNRHETKEMLCMQCLEVQPVAESCHNPECSGFRMARYYCNICKFFDDDTRDIYHCPFCNLCRKGKGLGIDYFHCMTCNACMHVSLKDHKCREKGLESNCPICHDFLFTSSSPVKALPCNHFMHSDCFQAYSCCHYTCPVCCKSLGDMAVYFGMLDALLAAEQLPEEYQGRVQDILCNDCEQKGTAPFHWLYHKCQKCGSYNTRTIYDGGSHR